MRDRNLDDEMADDIQKKNEEDWEELENTLRDKDNPAPLDVFLKIDGVDGESLDDKHKGEIEILGWKHSVLQSGTFGTGSGGGAGISYHFPYKVMKLVDKSSPKFFEKCASGEHFKQAVLVFRKAGKEQQEYRKITLTNVMIQRYHSFEQLDPVTGLPRDGVALDYGKIEEEHKAQKSADGTLGGVVKYGWMTTEKKKV